MTITYTYMYRLVSEDELSQLVDQLVDQFND